MYKAVIFDLDGVIVETEPQTFKFYQDYLSKNFNILIPDESFEKKAGRKSVDFFNDVLSLEDKKKINLNELIEYKRKSFAESLSTFIKPINYAKELLENLNKQGYLVALASQNEKQMIDSVIEWLQIGEYFKEVLSLQDITKKKPDPEIYNLALKRLNVKPGEAIIVEDSEAGVLSAKASGTKVIALRHSYTPKDHISNADFIVDNLNEVINIL